MSKVELLFDNKWVQVLKKTTDNNGVYIYSHHPWCNGTGVALLPFRRHPDYFFEFLGRYEICPAHSDEVELCSITGGYDNSDKYTIPECALNELREEAGYDCGLENLLYAGSVRASKSSDGITHLFLVDVDKCIPCEATSDGTLGEVGAYCDWINAEQLIFAKDPLLQAMYARFTTMLEVQNVDVTQFSVKIK